jgi:hypothetical protein
MSRSVLILLVGLSLGLGLVACTEKTGVSVSKVYPTRGPYIGGDPVTISGSGFTPSQVSEIYFGKNPAKRPVVKEGGDIVVDPPAGSVGETVDIVIILSDARTITLPKAYSYIDPTATAPAK